MWENKFNCEKTSLIMRRRKSLIVIKIPIQSENLNVFGPNVQQFLYILLGIMSKTKFSLVVNSILSLKRSSLAPICIDMGEKINQACIRPTDETNHNQATNNFWHSSTVSSNTGAKQGNSHLCPSWLCPRWPPPPSRGPPPHSTSDIGSSHRIPPWSSHLSELQYFSPL